MSHCGHARCLLDSPDGTCLLDRTAERGMNPVDTDELPPTQYLILEVLAARYRTGETLWTFPARLRSHVEQLADLGLIGWKSGVAPRTVMAWLTETGKKSSMSETYVPPNERTG